MLGFTLGCGADPINNLAAGNPVITGAPEKATIVPLLPQTGSTSPPLL